MCQHYWKVSSPEHGKHIIGKCRLCGATKDFTVLQAQDKKSSRQICLADFKTRPGVNMSTIMAVKKPKGRPSNCSRGRVR